METVPSPDLRENPPSGDCGIPHKRIRYIAPPERPQTDGPAQSSDGIVLGSANAPRLTEISEAVHLLIQCGKAFEQTEHRSLEWDEAGLSLDIALRRARAATATARAVAL